VKQQTPEYNIQEIRQTQYFTDYGVYLPQNPYTDEDGKSALPPITRVGHIEYHNVDVEEPYYVGWHFPGGYKGYPNGQPGTKSHGPFDTQEEAVRFVFFGNTGNCENNKCLTNSCPHFNHELSDTCTNGDCPNGGDPANDCADCAEGGDYHFVDGECVRRPE
jgi:hypothetical protein